MKNTYILHGMPGKDEYMDMDVPSPSNAHWIPWLQQKFLRAGILCQALEMPTPYAPVYAEWRAIFNRLHLPADSTIVAHSMGGGFILKWLHDHPDQKLEKLVLVAPWLDPANVTKGFLDFKPRAGLDDRIGAIHLLYSTDEPVEGIAETKDMIAAVCPKLHLHIFNDKGHFCYDELKGAAFPELWTICTAA